MRVRMCFMMQTRAWLLSNMLMGRKRERESKDPERFKARSYIETAKGLISVGGRAGQVLLKVSKV